MSLTVELRESVIDDLVEARAWYEKQRPGLGDEFLTAFDAALPILQHNAAFAPIYRDFRHLLIKRFPYGIYFRIEGEKVVVYRSHHCARSSARLRKSLRESRP